MTSSSSPPLPTSNPTPPIEPPPVAVTGTADVIAQHLQSPAQILEKSQKTLECIQKTVTDATDEINRTIDENLTDLKSLENEMKAGVGGDHIPALALLEKRASNRSLKTKGSHSNLMSTNGSELNVDITMEEPSADKIVAASESPDSSITKMPARGELGTATAANGEGSGDSATAGQELGSENVPGIMDSNKAG